MTVGITSLPIRSSPARGSLLLRAVQQLAHVHTSRPSSSPILESMLARAHSDYEANGPPQRSQSAKSFLPPSSPTKHNGDIRQQMKKPNAAAVSARTAQPFPKPLDNRSTNMNQPTVTRLAASAAGSSLASLYGGSNSFQQDPDVIDLTEADVVANSKAGVFFCENDFSDDDDLDLDFKAPSALPMLPAATPSKPSNENMPPPPTSQASKPFDWSSSPASHFLPPPRTTSVTSTTTDGSLKRDSSGDRDLVDIPAPKKAKKRVLPPQFKRQEPEEDEEDLAVAKTPVNKRKEFWNPTASAVKEQKKQFRNQRQQEQPTANNDLSTDEIQEITKSHSKAKGNFAISLSEEQRHVLDLVVNNNQSVFFTGAAGTGKSVLMRAIITELKKKYAKDPERVAVTASTGLAACNIGGITLHSFSGIGLGKEDVPTLVKKIRRNQKAKNRWLRTKCLIIDEVSMVDGDLFDKLSQIGRTIRNNGRPWGGIQLIITGDFFQLPPVPDGGKRETKFAFDASTWTTSIDHTIGLTQVFRQRDPTFANMLNEMRLGRISEDTVRAFKSLSRPLSFDDGVGTAELFSTRNEVEGSNERRLRELSGTVRRYDALDVGKEEIRDKLLMNMMAPKSIDLKINAQVMLIKNLDESLVNGSLGKVIGFSDEKTFDMTSVDEFDDDDPMAKARRKLLKSFSREADTSSSSGVKFPVVQFMATNGTSRVILCQPEEWKVELPNGEVQAKRTQLPLILAWALSIHKAQGQTLERVKVNLGRVFEKGQAYVALSRATTQEGLQVLGFEKSKVMAHPRVIQFYNQLYSAEDAIGKKPQSITDFVSNRVGAAPPKKAARQVVELDDEEEAMASYGY